MIVMVFAAMAAAMSGFAARQVVHHAVVSEVTRIAYAGIIVAIRRLTPQS